MGLEELCLEHFPLRLSPNNTTLSGESAGAGDCAASAAAGDDMDSVEEEVSSSFFVTRVMAVPPFSSSACGLPKDWNRDEDIVIVSQRTRHNTLNPKP